MFNFFRKKSEKEILQEKYRKLMEESHKLSHTNRKLADDKVFEAEEVLKKLEALV
ncbi:MAG: Lacal_2735 family protein [Flavobacteriaceae bacterium]